MNREPEWVDLHVHTTASDGTLTPAEVVALARKVGLKAIAITDHDTVTGVREGVEAGQTVGVEVIPGVEIGVQHHSGQMHILGYFLDTTSPDLLESLSRLQEYRDERNPKMAARLRELGFQVTMEEVAAIAGGDIVGRPHFATLLVKKGYATDNQEAFDSFLAYGRPGYIPKDRLTPEEGIKCITRAGGLAVLAHPGYLKESDDAESMRSLLRQLKQWGLTGVEAYYSIHSLRDEELLLQLAAEEGLLVTGGSDFHGKNKPQIGLGSGCGNLRIPYQLAELLQQKWQRTKNS
ncbi:MAG TPA: PHP domain-containing protein [Bacillota bacterium]|nr:PHP domain-containing protein [Bacillota bacterium]